MKLFSTKKHLSILILLSCTIILGTCSLLFYSPCFFKVPKYTVLINRLEESQSDFPNIQLYYSTPNQSHIRSYTLTNNTLSPLPITIASYTEGFLPLQEKMALLAKINTHIQPFMPLTYFYNYYKDPYYEIVAPTGTLSQIYFIDQITHEVKVPDASHIPPLKDFYLNHIVRRGDIYYLLGDTVGEYRGVLYSLDAITLKVRQYMIFKTSPYTVYRQHSSLNANGHVFFTTENGLGHVIPSQINTKLISLGFTPSYIVSSENQTVAFNFNTANLNYAQLNASGILTTSGQLPLPEEELIPVKALLQDSFLTILTFTPNHPFYANYVLIYDVTNWQLIYCCALQDLSPYMALDLTIQK